MKNQYFGDVNDYLKYSFLRAITVNLRETLLLCWMLTPPDEKSDGNLTQYLAQPDRFRAMDPQLFDVLESAVMGRERTVEIMPRSGLLPGASYHFTILDDAIDARAAYFTALWASAPDHNIIFFDPDNGLAPASVVRGRRNSSKYLFWDEFSEATERGLSTIVYQHFPRVAREEFLTTMLERMRAVSSSTSVSALYSPRVAYLVAATQEHATGVAQAMTTLQDAWGDRLRRIAS